MESQVKIDKLRNAQTNLALKTMCAGTNKANYSLRLNGDRISPSALQLFDEKLRGSLGKTLHVEVSDDTWEQSCGPLSQGSLGIHLAAQIALPAFVASRLSAAPMAEDILGT